MNLPPWAIAWMVFCVVFALACAGGIFYLANKAIEAFS